MLAPVRVYLITFVVELPREAWWAGSWNMPLVQQHPSRRCSFSFTSPATAWRRFLRQSNVLPGVDEGRSRKENRWLIIDTGGILGALLLVLFDDNKQDFEHYTVHPMTLDERHWLVPTYR